MQTESSTANEPGSRLLVRLGLPPVLAWGYPGILLFMIGDGVESGYLAPYLISHGYATSSVAWLFSCYGLMAGIAGWLSGSLSDVWGPRRIITCGFIIWVSFQVLFLTFGLSHGFIALLLTYGPRGLGYPLFAFGFLVWIPVVTPQNRLATAMGWFWFAFAGGLPALGSVVASWCVPHLGQLNTLWVGTAFVLAGGITLLVGVREPRGARRLVSYQQSPATALWNSITLIWRNPQTAVVCIARLINTAPEFGFLVILPTFFTQTIGFSLESWLRLLSTIFVSNVVWNLLFGFIGDGIGWVRTIALFGGVGCAISTLAIYYVPLWHHSYFASLIVGVLYGATLAGYTPISAIMASLAPDEKGAAFSLLNLGAGASVSLGPAIVAIFLQPFGVRGIIWIFSALYLVSAILISLLRPPKVQAEA